ncbi:hypothetical protein H9L39_11579, partial [Fusarium oxysporum f. sp. albedinis]
LDLHEPHLDPYRAPIQPHSRMRILQRIIEPFRPQARKMTTIASLKRLSAKSLSEKILEEVNATDPTFAVIDVRDNDYIGGHIKGSTNIPAHTLDAMMPTLVRRLKDKKTVVFHCALSQQRGPSAALKYVRERDGLLKSMGEDPKGESGQDVFVLDRGFSGWQEVYGEDERLTEGYVKDLWDNY